MHYKIIKQVKYEKHVYIITTSRKKFKRIKHIFNKVVSEQSLNDMYTVM